MTYLPKHRVIVHKPDAGFLDIYIIRNEAFTNRAGPEVLQLDGNYRLAKEGFEFKEESPTIRIPTNDQTELIELLINALAGAIRPVGPEKATLANILCELSGLREDMRNKYD